MVRFERDFVEQTLGSAPETVELIGRSPERTSRSAAGISPRCR